VIIVPKIVLVELNVVQEAQPERLFGARGAVDGELMRDRTHGVLNF
jgi:hypothetical protein